MSREAFNLDALDTDPTFREAVFAQFRARLNKMASSASTETPLKHVFEAQSTEVKSPKSDINSLILDYLTLAGYPKAAAKFSKEANLQPQQDGEAIRARQEIQQAIHTGSIEQAISALNELDPEILDKDPKLHFALLRLQLVELIRQSDGSDISLALKFATDQLAPRAATSQEFLKDLERTMALLIFPHDQLQPELASLLHSDLRRETAANVNEAVLRRDTDRREAAIRHLVKMRAWAETSARTAKKDLPGRIDLGLNGEDAETRGDGMFENGIEPMITT